MNSGQFTRRSAGCGAGHRSLSVSLTGFLAVRQDTRSLTRPAWTDRQGKELEPLSAADNVWWYAPRLAPGGRRVAISRYEVGVSDGDIWMHDFARNLGTRLTFEGGEKGLAVWSPDGRCLAYASTRPGRPSAIYIASPDRSGDKRLWFESEQFILPDFFTPDRREIVFEQTDAQGELSLWRRALEGTAEPRLVVGDRGGEFAVTAV